MDTPNAYYVIFSNGYDIEAAIAVAYSEEDAIQYVRDKFRVKGDPYTEMQVGVTEIGNVSESITIDAFDSQIE